MEINQNFSTSAFPRLPSYGNEKETGYMQGEIGFQTFQLSALNYILLADTSSLTSLDFIHSIENARAGRPSWKRPSPIWEGQHGEAF